MICKFLYGGPYSIANFVGLELRQTTSRESDRLSRLAEQIASQNALLLSEPEINQIRNAALNNENLTEEDAEQYRALENATQTVRVSIFAKGKWHHR